MLNNVIYFLFFSRLAGSMLINFCFMLILCKALPCALCIKNKLWIDCNGCHFCLACCNCCGDTLKVFSCHCTVLNFLYVPVHLRRNGLPSGIHPENLFMMQGSTGTWNPVAYLCMCGIWQHQCTHSETVSWGVWCGHPRSQQMGQSHSHLDEDERCAVLQHKKVRNL